MSTDGLIMIALFQGQAKAGSGRDTCKRLDFAILKMKAGRIRSKSRRPDLARTGRSLPFATSFARAIAFGPAGPSPDPDCHLNPAHKASYGMQVNMIMLTDMVPSTWSALTKC